MRHAWRLLRNVTGRPLRRARANCKASPAGWPAPSAPSRGSRQAGAAAGPRDGRSTPARRVDAGPRRASRAAAVAPAALAGSKRRHASRPRGRCRQPRSLRRRSSEAARRNLLFASTSRKERERAEAKAAEAAQSAHRRTRSLAPRKPPPASFEDAWPKPDRMRATGTAGRAAPRRRAGVDLCRAAPPADRRRTRAAAAVEQAPVTVLKSGIVDGMAYSLYSDGSIEAQMPEGMMRFASIDELRAHLDQRSVKAARVQVKRHRSCHVVSNQLIFVSRRISAERIVDDGYFSVADAARRKVGKGRAHVGWRG